jgi:ferredoxin, 2Fe-2S
MGMPQIKFIKKHPVIEVDIGDNLMRSLLRAQMPVASSCNGQGICGKCRVRVLAGADALSARTKIEAQMQGQHNLPPDMRLSCQCFVQGDVTVDTTYW